MSSGGGTTSTNTIQNADPWSGVQPYLKYGLQQAVGLYNRGPYGQVQSPMMAGGSSGFNESTGMGFSPMGAGFNTPGMMSAMGGLGGMFPNLPGTGGNVGIGPGGPIPGSNTQIGGAIGGFLGNGGGGGGGSATGPSGPSSTDPNAALTAPNLGAVSNFNVDPRAFLTAQSPYTLASQQMQAQQALDPSSLVSQAQNQLGKTISGQYLDPATNPAWNPMSQRITDAYSTGTAAQTDAAAARANALGGSGYNQQTQLNQRALGDSLSGLAGSLYNTERGYQQNALGMAPGLQLANINQLANVGAAQEQRGQAQLGAAQQAYMSPYSNLEMFRNLIAGTGGGSTSGSASSPYFTNPAGQAIGYGIGGLALYNLLSGLGGSGSSAALAAG